MVTLFCKANGFPRPVIGWLKNNKSVTSGTMFQNESISSLEIVFNEITEKPIKYRCIARNSLASTISEEATLTVARREARGRFQRRFQRFQSLIFTTNNTSTHTFIILQSVGNIEITIPCERYSVHFKIQIRCTRTMATCT